MFARARWLITASLLAVILAGCGYGFRSRANTWENEGIRRIYIEPLVNNTLRPGVEVVFTSALLKEFAQGGRIALVNDKKGADAVLTGTLVNVESRIFSQTTADQVSKDPPPGQGLDSTFVIATEYTASALINMQLQRVDGTPLWSQGFSRSRIYPAANQGGDIGNTGVLINESRMSMALGEIATFLAVEVHDLFFERF